MSYKVGFLDDMKQLIFDPKRSPDDLTIFTTESNWKLIGFEEQDFELSDIIPSVGFMKKKGIQGEEINKIWGKVEL
jgi:hypothetical protein